MRYFGFFLGGDERKKEGTSTKDGGFTNLYRPRGKSFTVKVLLFNTFISFAAIEIYLMIGCGHQWPYFCC